jgi:protein required for attachment to host cells
MKPIWIVVADNTQARFFTAKTRSAALDEIDTLTNSENRLHDRDITSDLPGKIKSTGGGGHAFEQPTDPKKHEADNFARLVAAFLEKAHNDEHFDELVIVAEPSFLGLLRSHLNEQVKKLVTFELDKNITTLDVADIRSHLPEYLPHL